MRRSMVVALVLCMLMTACAQATPTATPEPTATPRPTAIPTNTPLPTPTFTATRVPTATPIIYVVQPGDVLGIIAKKYGTTIEAIVEANGLGDPDFIQQGQELVIPPPGVTPTP